MRFHVMLAVLALTGAAGTCAAMGAETTGEVLATPADDAALPPARAPPVDANDLPRPRLEAAKDAQDAGDPLWAGALGTPAGDAAAQARERVTTLQATLPFLLQDLRLLESNGAAASEALLAVQAQPVATRILGEPGLLREPMRAPALAIGAPAAGPAPAMPEDAAAPEPEGASTVTATAVAAPSGPVRPVGPAAAAAAATAGVGAAALGLLGLSLYHRIRPAGTLDNRTRSAIFRDVCENPGVGIQELAERANVSYSTATYHLERLMQAGMVVMTPEGNKLRYYKNGGAFTESERRILPLVKNDEAARLLEAILDTPGTYRAQLAQRLGVTATTINWHLRRLREADLIEEQRQGRSAYLYARRDVVRERFPALAEKLQEQDPVAVERLRRYAAMGAA